MSDLQEHLERIKQNPSFAAAYAALDKQFASKAAQIKGSLRQWMESSCRRPKEV